MDRTAAPANASEASYLCSCSVLVNYWLLVMWVMVISPEKKPPHILTPSEHNFSFISNYSCVSIPVYPVLKLI